MLERQPLSRRGLAAAVAVAALLVAGPTPAAPGAVAAAGDTHVVTALGSNWDRREVSAVQGDWVEWRWQDGIHDLWIVDAGVPPGEEAGFEQQLSETVVPGSPPVTRYLTEAGAWDFYCKIHSGRGSESFNMSGTITVAPGEADVLAPTTTASLDPASPGPGGTYAEPVTVTLSATDEGGSGVAQTRYRIDGGESKPYGGPITVSAPGQHAIAYASSDHAGNVEDEHEVGFTITTVAGGGAPPPPPPPPPPPSPAPSGGSDPPPAPVADAALRRVPRRISGAALAKGLRVSGSCAGVAAGSVVLKVGGKQAARLRLPRRPATLARARVVCADGTFTATLKPSRKARNALRRLRRTVRATLALTMRGDGGKRADPAELTDTATLRIKGRTVKRG
jgi:plastocyanin